MASSRSRLPESLTDRVLARLAPLVQAGAGPLRLTLALSGGLDSSVLLHVLADLRQQLPIVLQACHVHHGLSPEADGWRAHCEAVCAALAVPCETHCVQVDRCSKAGLEAAAREARYRVLMSIRNDWLVLAHHADDQAETLLFRLSRGAGVKGAACMRDVDAERRIVRPLLHASRADLEAYARANQIAWVEDESNPDQKFSRNYLRHIILDPLRARFPGVVTNLVRSTSLFAESDELLSELAQMDAGVVGFGQAGSRTRWLSLSPARARNLLRHCLSDATSESYMPEMRHLDEGLRQVATSAATRWTFGSRAVCVYRDQLWFEPAVLAVPGPMVWQGESELPWGEGRILFPDIWHDFAPCRVETRRPATFWSPGAGRPHRSIKQLCQEAGVPPWWRALLPCVWRHDALLWVGGVLGDEQRAAGEVRPEWLGGWRWFQARSADVGQAPQIKP